MGFLHEVANGLSGRDAEAFRMAKNAELASVAVDYPALFPESCDITTFVSQEDWPAAGCAVSKHAEGWWLQASWKPRWAGCPRMA
jgi:hypothetical protein